MKETLGEKPAWSEVAPETNSNIDASSKISAYVHIYRQTDVHTCSRQFLLDPT